MIGAVSALAGADLSGKWVGSITLDRVRSLSLILHQTEQRVDGTIAVDTEAMLFPIRNAVVEKNRLTFSTVYGNCPLGFDLVIRKGKLNGHADYCGQAAKVTLSGPVVTFPLVLRRIEPEYTKEARKLKNQGIVVLSVQVDRNGKGHVKRVLKALGNGLDEKAIEAVDKWSFRPAYERGKPIAMETTVEVEFRLR